MSNEKETNANRTQLTDLPVAEQEMTAEEMENVLGGKLQVPAQPQVTTSPGTITTTSATTVSKEPPPALPGKTQTPL